MARLTEQERQEIVRFIEADKPLPEKYRFLLFDEKREVELVWNGKTNEVCNIVLPFQVIEHVDEPHSEKDVKLQPGLFDPASGRQLKGWTNKLIWGDNKLILASLKNGPLREEIEKQGGLKLIYIDPPFDVGADFSMDIEIPSSIPSASGVPPHAGGMRGVETFTKKPNILEEIAYRDTWGKGADSFIAMIYERLILMRDLLAEDGSIYVHCDWRVNSYIRLAMEEMFGVTNFQNHLTWKRTAAHNDSKKIGTVSDTILYFSKSENRIWNPQFRPYDQEYIDTFYRHTETDGRKYRTHQIERNPALGTRENLIYEYQGYIPKFGWMVERSKLEEFDRKGMLVWSKNGKPQRKIYLEEDSEGQPIHDIWDDLSNVGSQSKERANYPTQKPESLLERIINASSNEGDLIADFFCVRKGTLVLCPPAFGIPPHAGGVRGVETQGDIPATEKENGLKQKCHPPACGGSRGGGDACGGNERGEFKPIESLQIGDFVIGHDGEPHKIIKTFARNYRGQMVKIQTASSNKALFLTEDHLVLTKRKVQRLSENGGWSGVPVSHFDRARELRREATFPERKLWRFISGNKTGLKFRRQHPIGPYIADFYSRQAGLVVEVDGNFAHSSNDQVEHDAIRNQYMKSMGLSVLRIPAREVNTNIEGVYLEIMKFCKEQTLEDDNEKQWKYAKNISAGDLVFFGSELTPTKVTAVDAFYSEEEVFDIEVEESHSFITDVCAVHNCGSGTTSAVAEKLGRKWIVTDLGKFAIHTTRKRMIGVQRQLKADSKQYRAFEILNLGKYERQHYIGVNPNLREEERQKQLEEKESAFLELILRAYRAEGITGFRTFHGKKSGRLVAVGPVNMPVTRLFVEEVILECRQKHITKVDILAFEFEMGLFPNVLDEAKAKGIDISPKYIPAQVFDKRAVEKNQVVFHDVAFLDIKPHVTHKKGEQPKVAVELTDFSVFYSQDSIANAEATLKDKSSKIVVEKGQIVKVSKDKNGITTREVLTTHWTDWIDYWAVDFDFESKREIIRVPTVLEGQNSLAGLEPPQGQIKEWVEVWTGDYVFENEWQSFRTKKDRTLELKSAFHECAAGKRKIAVKVVDIFGNDTMKIVEVRV